MITPYPPQRDGIGDYAAELTSALRARDHLVEVVRPGELGGAAARLAALDPDVVHVQFAVAAFGSRTPALLRLLRRAAGTRARLVVTMHEVTRDTARLGAPGRALHRRLARRADEVIVHTPAALAALRDLAGPMVPARVVPHHARRPPRATTTADALLARHGLGDRPVLLAFGFVHPDKGLGDLVEALGLLGPGAADLVVAGGVRRRQGAFRLLELPDRIHLRVVRGRVARLGLRPRVRFTGFVPDGEVAPWLQAADAAVMPYRRIEQSGVGSLAATAGVPVLASSAGSLVEDYGERRWSFPPRSPERLAAVLGEFLASGPHRRAPRRGADAGTTAAATLDVYEATGRTHAGVA